MGSQPVPDAQAGTGTDSPIPSSLLTPSSAASMPLPSPTPASVPVPYTAGSLASSLALASGTHIGSGMTQSGWNNQAAPPGFAGLSQIREQSRALPPTQSGPVGAGLEMTHPLNPALVPDFMAQISSGSMHRPRGGLNPNQSNQLRSKQVVGRKGKAKERDVEEISRSAVSTTSRGNVKFSRTGGVSFTCSM